MCKLTISGQSVSYNIVENNVEDKSKLKIRPYVSFVIPPTEIVDGLPFNVNVEAQMWTKAFDIRGAVGYGTNIFGSIGITLHSENKEKSIKEKFITKRVETEKSVAVSFFRAPVNIHKISGPCIDVTAGVWKNAGLYPKLEFGWDFQSYRRAVAEVNGRKINGKTNSWVSFKYQVVVSSVNVDMTDYFGVGAGTSTYTEKRKMAAGFQINPSWAYRPWKKSTFFANLPMGYLKYMGVGNAPSTTSKGAPIFAINIGAQLAF